MSWISDLFGIKKDIAETKKAKLETEKLKKELSDIQIANLEQIKEYDPTTEEIERKIKKRKLILHISLFIFILLLLFAFMIIFGIFYYKGLING